MDPYSNVNGASENVLIFIVVQYATAYILLCRADLFHFKYMPSIFLYSIFITVILEFSHFVSFVRVTFFVST